ncbi:MAG: hypothetical protein ABI411_19750 [Tahibacter sp.]
MKLLFPGLVAIAMLALGGCATGGASHVAKTDPLPIDEVDQSKIVTVNEWAHRRGYGVQWINLPYKSRSLVAKDH